MELKINEVPKAVVTIRNRKFRVVSAIFHNSNSILSGYYYNMLRQDKNWIKVENNNVKKSSWPRSSKDVYILFLERIL